MMFSDVFERFVEEAPACVMHRATLEQVFSPQALDALFQREAQAQYQRELLFSTVVDLTSLVVCRVSNSVHAAYVRKKDEIPVSIRALYDKLNHVETQTSRALVRHTARRVGELIDRVQGQRSPLIKGYRARILDGNHLGKTQHRLGVLRETAAGALPGQALVLLDPQRMLIEDVFPCEDGHAQERSLLEQVLPTLQRGDLLIADRNFCTRAFLWGLLRRKACFIIRQHGRMACQVLGEPKYAGRAPTGKVYEQVVEVSDPKTGASRQLRRITLHLTSPTRSGEREVHLLSNLPRKVSAVRIARAYRQRWTLEQAFNELTVHLRCELNTLGYPKAALFAFCVAACSYNVLAAVQGALRGVHGEEVLATKVSPFFLADEIGTMYGGMMVALPPEEWTVFATMSLAEFAEQLRRWAKGMDLTKYPKQPRGPKKPKKKRPNAQFRHVATSKLLEEQRSKRRKPQASAAPDS